MILTERVQDALTEVLNIAMARTAASLSDLTGQRVLLDVPNVVMHPINELGGVLNLLVPGEVVTVHQIFSGQVAGDALLLLAHNSALTLVDLMTEEHIQAKRLNASAREVLIEIGNILLNACLGVFGNLLHVHVTFAVPRLLLHDLDVLLRSLTIGVDELRYGMVVYTTFRLRDSAVSGYLVIVLGIVSLEHLLYAVEQLG